MHVRFEAMVFVVAACTLTALTAYVFFASMIGKETSGPAARTQIYTPSGDPRFVEIRTLPND